MTDLRYAKLGKDAARAEQTKIRAAHRRKADKQGEALTLCSKCLDLMMLAVCMHKACEKDNAEKESVFWGAGRGQPSTTETGQT